MGKPRAAKDTKGTSDKTIPEEVDKTGGAREGGPSEDIHPDPLQLHLDKVLEPITASRKTLEQKIETVVPDMILLRADQRKVAESVTTNELALREL